MDLGRSVDEAMDTVQYQLIGIEAASNRLKELPTHRKLWVRINGAIVPSTRDEVNEFLRISKKQNVESITQLAELVTEIKQTSEYWTSEAEKLSS